MQEQRKVLVGTIGAAQGVRGEVRIKSFTGEPTAIARYGVLTTQDGHRSFEISSVRHLRDDMVVAKLKSVDDRAAAETLGGLRLYVARNRLPPLEADEVYHADLIGLAAVTSGAKDLGRVVGVENYGAGDIIEIDPGTGQTILVPFTSSFVPEVDLAGGRLVVAPGALAGSSDDEASSGPQDR